MVIRTKKQIKWVLIATLSFGVLSVGWFFFPIIMDLIARVIIFIVWFYYVAIPIAERGNKS